MARSAKPLEDPRPSTLGATAGALVDIVARNPALVGGSTAFLVALSFVSANALWYQPHAHSGAFFATREFLRPAVVERADTPEETTILIERPEPQATVEGDPQVKSVQATLKQLNFYAGEVDGLYGPNTKVAIEAYQSRVGLPVTGAVDDRLLDQLGTGSISPRVLPTPAPRQSDADTHRAAPQAVSASRDEMVATVQRGLREFGNETIEIDGLVGAKTEAAIREFQSLFGLPVTGKADRVVQEKMKEIGLVE